MAMPFARYFWEDSRFISLYGAGASVVLLVMRGVRGSCTRRTQEDASITTSVETDTAGNRPPAQRNALGRLIERAGGPAIFIPKLTRLLCCVVLFALSLVTSLQHTGIVPTRHANWLPWVESATYGYSSVLAAAYVFTHRHSRLFLHHLSFVLLVVLAVYAWRDIVPLLLRNHSPTDAAEGVLIWVKLFVLFEAAVALPLLIPRAYTRSKAADVTEKPNKEQTASLASLFTFNWLNETVAKASRVTHLALDELPTLAKKYTTKDLVERSFPQLDPFQLGKSEHIFWGLLRVFRSQYILFVCLAGLFPISSLARPIATKGLLEYLEARGPQSNIYPWVWILLLFLGDSFVTFTEEWTSWISGRQNICNEAIVTELLFEHALRIRVKSETSQNAEEPTLNSEGTSSTQPVDKKTNLVGRLNNLITSDLRNVSEGNKFWLHFLITVPMMLVGNILFVYSVLGWSALVGLASICVLFLVPGYLSSWIQSYQASMMSNTDARVQMINEVLNVIRMVKLFGWEQRVTKQVEERRESELQFLRKAKFLELTNNLINYSIPLLTMVITFATYTILQHGELTASRLFSTYTAFLMIRQQIQVIFFFVPVITQARVSLDRIDDFLHTTELLDEFDERKANCPDFCRPPADDSTLGIRQTTFTWANEGEAQTPTTPGGGRQRKFVLNIDGEVTFKLGHVNLVVGPTGSGKTSLLMALLGEMHAIPSGPESRVSLPRSGGVAYAAQESWIQNESIRDNILFGSPYDEVRYNKVIKQCALERDLSLFDAGDKTEVGEKGITLSGGQKARITLARAVYSSAEILLLDDVLAALDVHTGRWIVDECFQGDLVRGRTVILVSHNIALTQPIADFVVSLGTDGRIVSQGSLDKALKADRQLLVELQAEEEELKKSEVDVDEPKVDGDEVRRGKLVVAEEIGEGHVGWNALQMYLKNTARVRWLYWLIYIGALCITHVLITCESYFLGYWTAQYEEHAPSEISAPFYLTVYFCIVVAIVSVYVARGSLHIHGSIRASRIIHKDLVASVLGTTLRWLDMTPTSRIIARCTADIQCVDATIPRMLHLILEGTAYMIFRIGAVTLMTPIFIAPALIVAFLAGWISQMYMRAQICVKREMSNARAPVLGHFGSAITGLVSIRAYGAQVAFKRESYIRMDRYNRAGYIYDALSRWVNMRVETLGSALSAGLAAYLTYVVQMSASHAGFTLFMAVGISSFIVHWLRIFNDFQVTTNSLERIQQYMSIEQEPKPTKTGVPPAYWPASGDLRVEKLAARYSADGPKVLHDLSFEVKSGERIGIVGRTGSGKSSLTLALLRCILTEGRVYYDGIPTDSINLDALRSNITIIPQSPELLSGSLRQNLDPFGQYDDGTLNDALRSAGLFSLQEEADHARITLDTEIAGGGGNLSVGQRQIIALARAIVRRSKLLILDEATSAIDYDTDTVIQKSLREELSRDVTVLTVAHRLQSIMDADKIMVLDAGHIVEYDKPSELLKKDGGYFRGLVDGSGDRAALYSMAGCSV